MADKKKPDPVQTAADAVAEELDTDVLYYSGDISQSEWVNLIKLCSGRRRRRSNVLLLLLTPGGDPDAAYKIGRSLQTKYTKFCTFVPGWCKSAGTLIVIASSTQYIGDMGELGPLDIQVAKQDELDEMASSLLLDATMRTLESTASRMFLSFLRSVRRETGISTRTAANLSAQVITGSLAPIFSQIEPLRIGENARAMNITKAYAQRLDIRSRSINPGPFLDALLSGYPDHGFVIDKEEAATIFRDVKEPTDAMLRLWSALGEPLFPRTSGGRGSHVRADIRFLSTEPPTTDTVATAESGGIGDGQAEQDREGSGEGSRVRPARPPRKRNPRPTHRANGGGSPAPDGED